MVIPSSCALSNLDPAASPATKKSVFEDTEDDAFPPRDVIASAAPSLVKSTNEPVTTRVNPARVCLTFLSGHQLMQLAPSPTFLLFVYANRC